MSPRIKRIRKILDLPIIKGFKPYGADSELPKSEPVTILFEEYEALRLCDYDMFNHHKASEMMNVSRSTFTRIYASARQKVAKAFVKGSQIVIKGGKVYFDTDWFSCQSCNCFFNNPAKEMMVKECPLCGSDQVNNYACGDPNEETLTLNCDTYCQCTNCGYEQIHENNKPCNQQVCPKCNASMKRKNNKNCNQ